MSHKLFFVLALLIGVSQWAAAAERPLLRLRVRHTQKISKLSGDPLILSACQGLGPDQSECASILQGAAPHQKANAGGLAFYALKFVEDHAVALTANIKNVSAFPNLTPLFQSALSECMEQYDPLDDLIEDAINAVLANANADAQQFTQAAITNVDVCDSQLKASNVEAKAENKEGQEIQWSEDLKDSNIFLKNILTASLNILKAN